MPTATPDNARAPSTAAAAQRSLRLRAPHLRLVEPSPELPPVLARRDPDTVRRLFPMMATIADHYYRGEVEGKEHLRDDASLLVATHNGSYFTPDAYVELVAFWRRFGLETPLYMLAHKVVSKLPVYGRLAERVGAIPANWDNARLALRHNAPVMICPGGDIDVLKPYAHRHRITFGKRRGFIKLAIEEQVPIVPMVSVGAHEVVMVLNDGVKLARLIRFDRYFRIKTVPITLGFPFGLSVAGLGAIPLPSKVKVKVLPPIDLGVPRSASRDEKVVERCFQRVQRAMQQGVDELAAARRWPVFG